MRISWAPVARLAVAALALGTANGVYVTFGPDGFVGNSNLAIFPFQTLSSRHFSWTTESGVVVNTIDLFSLDSEDPEPCLTGSRASSASPEMGGQPGADPRPSPTSRNSVSPASTSPVGDPKGQAPVRRIPKRFPGLSLQVLSSTTGGNVTFQAAKNEDWDQLNVLDGVTLFFKAYWDGGASYSRPFLLVLAGQGDEFLTPEERDRLARNDPYKLEEGTPVNKSPKAGELPNSTGSPPSESSGISTDGEPTVSGGSNKGSGGGGGLSSGAVIGIAVACGVVGLVLAFALVWFLVRRRQQKKPTLPADSSFASGNHGDELMAEKEAGADADATPHSPYSDDGNPSGAAAGPSGTTYPDHHRPDPAIAAGAVGVAITTPHPQQHQQQQPQDATAPRSFTPYSDLSPTPTNAAAVSPSVAGASLSQPDESAPRVSVPSATPGRSTPRALTTPYAHLVEDGMTEEEIRRLEDEERQLDAAIEQAGRR